jgi:hypothetical protein
MHMAAIAKRCGKWTARVRRRGLGTVCKGLVTVFESPDLLAKTWALDASGQAVKSVAAQMWRGTYSVQGFPDVGWLRLLLDSVTTRQAISASRRTTPQRRAGRRRPSATALALLVLW